MKHCFRMLAVAALGLLSGTTAMAGSWNYPAPKGQALSKDTVYLWNVGQGGFVIGGEAYGTQAVVDSASGNKFVVVAKTDSSYVLKNATLNTWIFRVLSDGKVGDATHATFVDHGKDEADDWTVQSLGDNVYTFQITPGSFVTELGNEITNPGNWYWGVQTDHASKVVTDNNLTQTLGVYYDVESDGTNQKTWWKFVSVDEYTLLSAKIKLYNLLNQAEAEGVSTDAAATVYNNDAATVDDINAAYKALTDAVADRVTPENPQDVTLKYFTNPGFDTGVGGWSYTTKAQNHGTATNVTNDPNNNPDGAFTGNFYENWNPKAFTGKMYQTAKNLPNGVYKISLAAFNNAFDTDNATTKEQYVFANGERAYLTTGKAHKYELVISLDGDVDTLSVGLAQDSTSSNWMGIDNLSVMYYGKSLASYQYLSTNLQDTYKSSLGLDNATYSESYVTAVDETLANGVSATTKEAAMAAYKKAQEQITDLETNISLYKKLVTMDQTIQDEDGKDLYGNYSDDVNDVDTEISDMISEQTATNEEMQALLAKADSVREAAKKLSYHDGDDITSMITNPTFYDDASQSQNFTGWTIEGAKPGAGGDADPRLCEVYEGDFNLYQDITKLKKGAYRVQIQAFDRPGSINDVATKYAAGDTTTFATVYLNDNSVNMCNIMSARQTEAGTKPENWSTVSYGDGSVYVPNMMTSAYELMDKNTSNYLNTVDAMVTDGTLRLGLKSYDPANTGSRWCIFRDFKLIYLGSEVSEVSPVAQAVLDKANALVNSPMSAEAKTELNTQITAMTTAISNADASAIIDTYSPLLKAYTAAVSSVASYDSLQTAVDELNKALDEYASTAREASLATAKSVKAEAEAILANGTLADSKIAAEVDKVNGATNALKVPKGVASDDNPMDLTSLIQNPDYAATTGWTISKIDDGNTNLSGNPGIQANTCEGWNCNFDVSQTINGLSEGTYKLTVNSFFRPVTAEWAWNAYVGDSIGNSIHGRLFANKDSVAPKNWIFQYDPTTLPTGDGGWSTCTKTSYYVSQKEVTKAEFDKYVADCDAAGTAPDTVTVAMNYYYPNDRTSARVRFNSFNGLTGSDPADPANYNPYYNEIYTYVDATGKLTFGFCNHEAVVQDWFVASDWKLYYLGTESSHESATGITDVNTHAKVARTEYYTVDGRRVNKFQQGVTIVKTTDVNGKVNVTKVVRR